jgi:hypothetical protein
MGFIDRLEAHFTRWAIFYEVDLHDKYKLQWTDKNNISVLQ